MSGDTHPVLKHAEDGQLLRRLSVREHPVGPSAVTGGAAPAARSVWILLVVLGIVTTQRIDQSLGECGILGEVLVLLSALLPMRGVPCRVEPCSWIRHGTERTTRR